MAAAYRDSVSQVSSGATITVSSAGLTFSAGDVLVLRVFGFSTVGAPTGGNTTWTQQVTTNTLDPFANTVTQRLYTGVAGATITDFTLSNGQTDEYAWDLVSVSGANTSTPNDGTATGNAAIFSSVANPTAPSVTTSGTDSLLVCAAAAMAASDAGFTFTAPGGMTEREDYDGFYGFTLATEALSASGATGTRAFTETPALTGVGEYWIASSLAIQSAAGGAPALTVFLEEPIIGGSTF